MIVQRDLYMKRLQSSIGNGMVKVITGPRRCGKSFLLFTLFRNHLLDSGVEENHVLPLNLEDPDNASYCDPYSLLAYFKERVKQDSKTTYILIDEIQYVQPKVVGLRTLTFYDALNKLLTYPNIEVFVTGSNSHMLSRDIATEFRGRGWVIPMHPLTFSEYLCAYPNERDITKLWQSYFQYGGMPALLSLNSQEDKRHYLQTLYNSIYIKDIIERNNLQNEANLKDLVHILASSIGSLINPNRISNIFSSREKTKLSAVTIKKYLELLEDAFLLEETHRYNVKGNQYIGTPSKFYFEDVGIRNAVLGFIEKDEESHLLENIVYNELRARGYDVHIGVVESRKQDENGSSLRQQYEIDFVAEKGGVKFYIQVAHSVASKEKLHQETTSLRKVKDSFKKILISRFSDLTNYDAYGILHMTLFDFLLKPELLEDPIL